MQLTALNRVSIVYEPTTISRQTDWCSLTTTPILRNTKKKLFGVQLRYYLVKLPLLEEGKTFNQIIIIHKRINKHSNHNSL